MVPCPKYILKPAVVSVRILVYHTSDAGYIATALERVSLGLGLVEVIETRVITSRMSRIFHLTTNILLQLLVDRFLLGFPLLCEKYFCLGIPANWGSSHQIPHVSPQLQAYRFTRFQVYRSQYHCSSEIAGF